MKGHHGDDERFYCWLRPKKDHLDKTTLELIRGGSDLAKDLGIGASAVVVGA